MQYTYAQVKLLNNNNRLPSRCSCSYSNYETLFELVAIFYSTSSMNCVMSRGKFPGKLSQVVMTSKNRFCYRPHNWCSSISLMMLQRESLLKLLETNHLDVESCMEELRYEPSSEEQNYD